MQGVAFEPGREEPTAETYVILFPSVLSINSPTYPYTIYI